MLVRESKSSQYKDGSAARSRVIGPRPEGRRANVLSVMVAILPVKP